MIPKYRNAFVFVSAAISMIQGIHAEATSISPWERPRNLSDFQPLLHHSPFSLPTAEESSPLSERYAITGIVTIGGEEQIFIFDRTDQSRDLLTHAPNLKNMSLIALDRSGNLPPQKATIRVGDETGVIGYKAAAPQQSTPVQTQAAPGSVAAGMNPGMRLPRLPQLPQLPQQPNAAVPQSATVTPPAQSHIIIRRPVVNPPRSSSTTQ